MTTMIYCTCTVVRMINWKSRLTLRSNSLFNIVSRWAPSSPAAVRLKGFCPIAAAIFLFFKCPCVCITDSKNSCYAEAMQEISIETINNLGFRFTAPSWTRTIIDKNYFRLEKKMKTRNWTMRGVARKRSFDRTVVKKCPKCEQQVPNCNIQKEIFNHNMFWCLH